MYEETLEGPYGTRIVLRATLDTDYPLLDHAADWAREEGLEWDTAYLQHHVRYHLDQRIREEDEKDNECLYLVGSSNGAFESTIFLTWPREQEEKREVATRILSLCRNILLGERIACHVRADWEHPSFGVLDSDGFGGLVVDDFAEAVSDFQEDFDPLWTEPAYAKAVLSRILAEKQQELYAVAASLLAPVS